MKRKTPELKKVNILPEIDDEMTAMKDVPVRTEVLEDFDGSLEELFAMVQHAAKAHFLHHGQMTAMFFLLLEKDGKYELIQVPWLFSDDEEKAAKLAEIKFAINMKKNEEVGDIKSYAFAAEGWDITDTTLIGEALTVTAVERGRPDGLSAIAEIQRHTLSQQPNLGEWVASAPHGGNVLNLFENDTTKH
jgi:hypothetical protein